MNAMTSLFLRLLTVFQKRKHRRAFSEFFHHGAPQDELNVNEDIHDIWKIFRRVAVVSTGVSYDKATTHILSCSAIGFILQ